MTWAVSAVSVRVALDGGAALAPPDLSQSARLTLEQWDGNASAVWGCVGADVGGWSDDATEIVQGKLIELASSTAERLRGVPTPMHATHVTADGRDRTLDADDGSAYAHARTFLVFTDGQVHGCFLTCVGPQCDTVVTDALVEGSLRDAPPPGIVLGTLGAVVHHPHAALASIGALILVAAALAIARRPKKRPPNT